MIRGLQQALQATVIMVTHDRGVAESCPRIIRIQDGHLIEDRRQ